MKNLTVRVPDALAAKLTAYARKNKATKAAVVREALEAKLAQDKQRPKGKLRDLAADLIGSVEGPGDLSSNPKYMKDFGR